MGLLTLNQPVIQFNNLYVVVILDANIKYMFFLYGHINVSLAGKELVVWSFVTAERHLQPPQETDLQCLEVVKTHTEKNFL